MPSRSRIHLIKLQHAFSIQVSVTKILAARARRGSAVSRVQPRIRFSAHSS
jgi:hypothetical protein